MRPEVEDMIARVAGSRVTRIAPLSGGTVAGAFRVDLENGQRLAAKTGGRASGLDLEGFMLRYLGEKSRLPVPRVLHADDRLLLMSFVETDGGLDASAETHAADLLAELHAISAPAFGFERDTVIGGLPQPNPWTPGWRAFFRDRRLLAMARQALDAGRLAPALMGRIEALAGRIERWLEEPAAPSLIHGDMWGGNVLCRRGRIAGFVDPAIYYADAEIELAFSTLFGTFGDAFFARYGERRPLRPGFFEARRDLLNLYPLLVHVRLFGGGYAGRVERTLRRFGC